MGDSEDFFAIEERNVRLYEEGRQLFLRGKYDDAIEPFKRIYEDTMAFRDVAQIVEDYYGMDTVREWIAKYEQRFRDQSSTR